MKIQISRAMFLNVLVVVCSSILFVQAIDLKLRGDSVISIECTYGDIEDKVRNDCKEGNIIIRGESGYKILITVTSVDIKGVNGDYLLIKSGSTLDDGLSGRIFTHQIRNVREYISVKEEVFIMFVIHNEMPQLNRDFAGFTLTAAHYGERVTTLPPITTERPWPTPSEEDSPFIRVNLTVYDFQEASISSFQEMVAEMAVNYVNATGLILDEPISAENVQVNQSTRCPQHLPDADKCVQILFALPVFLAEESKYYGTYQLNHTLLERMWEHASEYMTDPSFDLYQIPSNSNVIAMWMIIFCCIALLYGLFYFVSGYECTGYVLRKKKKEDEDRQHLSSEDNDRSNSVASMSPHPFQPMPALFDCDVTYYDPDSPVTLRSPGRAAPRTEHDDTHDTLDSTNLNVRTFSFNGQNLEEVTET